MKPSSKVIAGKGKPARAVAGPVTRASVSDGKTTRSVSVRKIENGYIVSEDTYGGRKGYQSVERFVEKPPTIDVTAPKGKR